MKKILIIDEDFSLFKIYNEMFSSDEVEVVGAKSGQEGLGMISSEKPDLIMLDIMLPGGMNGFDVLEKLKADPLTEKIPVVVLTNLDSEEKVAKTIGACDYIVKSDTTKDELVKIAMSCLNSPLSAKR